MFIVCLVYPDTGRSHSGHTWTTYRVFYLFNFFSYLVVNWILFSLHFLCVLFRIFFSFSFNNYTVRQFLIPTLASKIFQGPHPSTEFNYQLNFMWPINICQFLLSCPATSSGLHISSIQRAFLHNLFLSLSFFLAVFTMTESVLQSSSSLVTHRTVQHILRKMVFRSQGDT